ncbi:endonuclease/exonuclease/phosphatase family protein [Steroidobacter sp. S1-65]|uniref:Endonuclease/exonuclease/phosphatase family protein n=1 Tax=Steroidobacter gossypii TaxID=2805490 RepID=A0ABS1X3L1_9GAMM|nr:endonuclease/exonuclease/phosphatase family protein [Steroidobacter gossypii]MBM0107813.1 endonuclease/exonuclease/phosphatase family protein [Steroidobacter gossypii]
METALAITGWIMIAATVLPLSRSAAWWVRIFDFPRLQITLCFIVVFAMYLLVREDPGAVDNVFLGLLGLCLAYQLWRMYPYTPLARVQVEWSSRHRPEALLGIFISNVFMDNRRAELLRKRIVENDPDIILVVETDQWWEQALQDLEASHPHVVKCVLNNTYGMMLFSRFELLGAEVRFLIEDDVPSIATQVKLPSGDAIQLRCVHPRPPAPQENERSTERDAELLVVAKELRGRDEPAIVVGDLNDVAWSRTNHLFQKISGLLDPRIGRGFFSTFNANWPLLRFPLDHVFCSKHFRVRDFKVLSKCGSDHFPVFARLSLEPDATAATEEPTPSPDDEAEAREKIEDARED